MHDGSESDREVKKYDNPVRFVARTTLGCSEERVIIRACEERFGTGDGDIAQRYIDLYRGQILTDWILRFCRDNLSPVHRDRGQLQVDTLLGALLAHFLVLPERELERCIVCSWPITREVHYMRGQGSVCSERCGWHLRRSMAAEPIQLSLELPLAIRQRAA